MTHHKQPTDPDTDLAIKKLESKGLKVVKNGKHGWRWWIYGGGIIMLGSLVSVLEYGQGCAGHAVKVWNLPDVHSNDFTTLQGEISTVQMRQSEDREWKAQISQQVNDIKGEMDDMKTDVRQILDNQNKRQEATPPPKAKGDK